MDEEVRRLKRLFKDPNPLFTAWLTEWKEEAETKDTKMKYVYAAALKSLRQYPLPLSSGKSCNILKGFGVALCTRLDERLQRHVELHGPLPSAVVGDRVEIGGPKPKPPAKKRTPKPKSAVTSPPSQAPQPPAVSPSTQKSGRKSVEYRPKSGSGAFALLVTLRQHEREDGYAGFLHKSTLQEAAQPLCSTSFTLPDAGGYYTAWSTMSTLVKKMLVHREGNPARFSLTPAGRELADRLQASPAALPSQRHRFDRLGAPPCAAAGRQDQAAALDGSSPPPAGRRSSDVRLSPLRPSPPSRTSLTSPGNVTGVPACSAAAAPLQYRYISSAGTEVHRKDAAHVSVEDGRVGFLVRCRRSELAASGRRYWSDPSRAERDGVLHVFLADSDCAETCPAGPLPGMVSGPVPVPVPVRARTTAGGGARWRLHDMSDSDGGEECEPPPASPPEWRAEPPLKRAATDWAAALKRLRGGSPTGDRPAPPAPTASSATADDESILLSDDDDDDDDAPSLAVSPPRPAAAAAAAAAATGRLTPAAERAVSSLTAGPLGAGDRGTDSAADGAQTSRVRQHVMPPPARAENRDRTAPQLVARGRERDRPPTAAETIRECTAAAAEARARARDHPPAVDKTRGRPVTAAAAEIRPKDCPLVADGVRKPPVAAAEVRARDSGLAAAAAEEAARDFRPTVVLPPGTFDILLCVDNQETSGKSGPGACLRTYRDVVVAELQKNGVVADVRKLSVGDFLWVARPHTGRQPEELVLPYVVERKRLDDLASSIRDSRYREQKFRLKRCGITNVIYLAEAMGTGPRAQSVRLPEATLQQALANCQVVDGFRVKRTADQRETAAFLTLMTRRLQRQYQYRQLEGCPRDLLPTSPPAAGRPERLQLFSEFHQLSAKRQRLTAGDLFAKMLLQLAGLSADKAAAIVSAYPSVARLRDGYRRCGSPAEAEALLAPLRAQKTGRPVGAAVSRAVYHLYCDQQLV